MIKMKDLKITSLRYYLNDNLITHNNKYIEFHKYPKYLNSQKY